MATGTKNDKKNWFKAVTNKIEAYKSRWTMTKKVSIVINFWNQGKTLTHKDKP